MIPLPDLQALLRLHRAVDGDPVAMAGLLSAFGDAGAIFENIDRAWLSAANFPEAITRRLLDAEDEARSALDLAWLDQPGNDVIDRHHQAYPALLKEIPDAPFLLFVRGRTELLQTAQIAVVGSRRMTQYGRRAARRFGGDLARAGLTVTSGLALGIDAEAHRAALEADGNTIAVLGCGGDRFYPRANRRLQDDIAARGLLVSEFPLGAAALPHHFPRRNRIVTGMCHGTVVIEAAQQSGSLISARLAADQGREVFAVPGSIFSRQSRGGHELIRAGASLVESVEDLLQELPGYSLGLDAASPSESVTVAPAAKPILEYLEREPASVDDLAAALSLEVDLLISTLTELELAGIVESTPAGYLLS